MFMSGSWLAATPAPTTGYRTKKNNNNFGDKTNSNSVYYPQHSAASKNNEGHHNQGINSPNNGSSYLMKILGKDSQWIETSDQVRSFNILNSKFLRLRMGRELDTIRTTTLMETQSWSDILLAETDFKFWSRKEFPD